VKKVIFIAGFKPSKIASKSEKIIFSVRMDKERLTEIDNIASEAGISRNELIVQCVDFAISQISVEKHKKVKK